MKCGKCLPSSLQLHHIDCITDALLKIGKAEEQTRALIRKKKGSKAYKVLLPLFKSIFKVGNEMEKLCLQFYVMKHVTCIFCNPRVRL